MGLLRALATIALASCAVTTSSDAQSWFAAEQHVPGGFPVALTSADFDADGRRDVAVLQDTDDGATLPSTVRVLMGGAADGVLALSPSTWAVPGVGVDLATGDFDGDGHADLAVLVDAPDELHVFLGDGAGGFPASMTLTGGTTDPTALAAGDLNGDDQTDLVFVSEGGGFTPASTVFLSDGAGGFLPPLDVTVGLEPVDVLAVDMDDDTDLDLVVLARQDETFEVLRNVDGLGTLVADPAPVATGIRPIALAAADFDDDGRTDVVVAHDFVHTSSGPDGYSEVQRFVQSGAGTFTARPPFETGQCPIDVHAVDLDDDGDADLALAVTFRAGCGWSVSSGYTYVYDHVADAFAPGSTFHAGHAPQQLVVEDLDGDGERDVVVANRGRNGLPLTQSVYVDVGRDDNPSGPTIRFDQLLGHLGSSASSASLEAYVYAGAGGGPVAADFDNNGWADLYLVQDNQDPAATGNQLFLNRRLPAQFTSGGDPFTEVMGHGAEALGVSCTGAVAADFDNDGWVDLYVGGSVDAGELGTCVSFFCREILLDIGGVPQLDRLSSRLYLNDGDTDSNGWDGTFTDETVAAGVTNLEFTDSGLGFARVDLGNARALTVGDFDRDGWLDIYTGNFFRNGTDDLDNSEFGMPNALYMNQGVDGGGQLTFVDMADSAGVRGTLTGSADPWLSDGSSALGLFVGDVDDDGWPDLYVANDMDWPDGSPLYLNDGDRDGDGTWDGTFTERARAMGIENFTPNAMGCDLGDFDGDGWLDFAVSDTMRPQGGNVGCALFETDPRPPLKPFAGPPSLDFDAGQGRRPIDVSVVDFANPIGAGFGWHVGFEDFDADGDEDLHVSTTKYMSDMLYRNDGVVGGRPVFVNVGGRALGFFGSAKGAAYADFDHDGRTDVFQINPDEGATLWMNATDIAGAGFHWLQVRARTRAPTGVYRDAVSGRVIVRADVDGDGVDEKLIREIQVGEGASACTSETVVRFGLGVATQGQVVVRWLDGTRTVRTNVAADQRLTILQR